MPKLLVNSALQRTFWAQTPTLVLHVHSDHSGQYHGNTYRQLLHDY
jgi:hypothetical protein